MQHLLLLAYRDLVSRKARTFLTFFGIVIGVAVILAVNITNKSTIESFLGMIKSTAGETDFFIVGPSDAGFDQTIENRIKDVDGVDVIAPIVTAERTFIEVKGEKIPIRLEGVDPKVDRRIRSYKMNSGLFLNKDSKREVLMVEEIAKNNKINIGDEVGILTSNEWEKFKVIGFLAREGVGNFNSGYIAFINISQAQKSLNKGNNVSRLDIKLVQAAKESVLQKREIENNLKKRLGSEYSVVHPATVGREIEKLLFTLQFGLSLFSVIALFVGGFLIYNTFSMIVTERTREIGLLRSIGATRKQILSLMLIESIFLGFWGSLAGQGAGIGLAKLLMLLETWALSGVAGYAIKLAEFKIPTSGIVLSIFVGLFITFVASLQPALSATRITPMDALQPERKTEESSFVRYSWIFGVVLIVYCFYILNEPLPFAGRESLLMQIKQSSLFFLLLGASMMIPILVRPLVRILGPILSTVFRVEGRLARDNVSRKRGRSGFTAAALMVSLSMIIGFGAVTASFRYIIEEWTTSSLGADLMVFSQTSIRKDLEKEIKRVEGVDKVVAVRMLRLNIKVKGEEKRVIFIAAEPQKLKEVSPLYFEEGDREEAFKSLEKGGNVLICSILAERYGVKMGDTIDLSTDRGIKKFNVAGVITDFTETGEMSIRGSWADMQRNFGVNDASSFFVSIKKGTSFTEVEKKLKDGICKKYDLDVFSAQEMKKEVNLSMEKVFSLFNIVIYLAIIVSTLGIINTLTMGVLERIREIGILRAIGTTKSQIRIMILSEAIMIGLIGGLFGILLGLYISKGMVAGTSALSGMNMPYIFSINSIIIGFIVAIVVSIIASIYPGRKAAGLDIVRSVQYE